MGKFINNVCRTLNDSTDKLKNYGHVSQLKKYGHISNYSNFVCAFFYQ